MKKEAKRKWFPVGMYGQVGLPTGKWWPKVLSFLKGKNPYLSARKTWYEKQEELEEEREEEREEEQEEEREDLELKSDLFYVYYLIDGEEAYREKSGLRFNERVLRNGKLAQQTNHRPEPYDIRNVIIWQNTFLPFRNGQNSDKHRLFEVTLCSKTECEELKKGTENNVSYDNDDFGDDGFGGDELTLKFDQQWLKITKEIDPVEIELLTDQSNVGKKFKFIGDRDKIRILNFSATLGGRRGRKTRRKRRKSRKKRKKSKKRIKYRRKRRKRRR